MASHRSFYQNTAWQYGLQAARVLLPFLTLPYLTRVLGPETYAVYAFVFAFMVTVQVIVEFGFNLSGTKQVAQATSVAEINRIVGSIMVARLLLCVVVGVVVSAIVLMIPITRDHLLYVALTYVAVCLRALAPDFVFEGRERMGPLTNRFLAARGTATILVFAMVRSPEDLLWIPVLEIIAAAIALVWSFASAKRLFGTGISRVPLQQSLADLRTSGIYCVSSVASTTFSGFSTLLIGIAIADPAQVSYWSVATSAVVGVQALFVPVIDSLYPHIVNNGDFAFVRRAALVSLPVILAGTVAFVVLSPVIVRIIGGPEFLPAASLLVWLAPVLPFSYYAMLFGWPTLGAAGKVTLLTNITIVTAVLSIAALLTATALGLATMLVICVIRSATEAVFFGLRFHFARRIISGGQASPAGTR